MPDEETNTAEGQGNTDTSQGGAAQDAVVGEEKVADGVVGPIAADLTGETPHQTEEPADDGEAASEGEKAAEGKSESDPAAIVPEDPAGYKIELPDGVPVDPVFETGLREVAHTNKLSQGVMNDLLSMVDAANRINTEAAQKARDNAEKVLKGEWGKDYTAKVESAARAVIEVGGEPMVRLLEDTGYGDNPDVIKFMAKIGDMLTEDTFVDGTGRVSRQKRDEMGNPILAFKNM